ncbi:SOS response-associated peptidase [Microbacterium sp. 8M]|uniref:SOS response-associated peptidase n=1 Tax=Microbacterium sp. 8M TaxID=2653153 RepID=UPI0013588D44|nr:SOS response-associated peptidase [Microbacterium sp. 8M]
MCGRFAMNAKTDELIQEFVAHGGDPQEWWKEWHGSYSIAPTDSAPIVRDRGDGRFLELVRWDWEKPKNMRPGAPLINARVEKLATGFWAPAFTAARCVVPMRGYFEWTGEKGAKIPHYLHGDGLLAAAGLTWSMDLHGEPTRCFVVVTREARDAGGEVHDRMPAFLTPDAMDAWLEPVKLDRGGREDMLALLDGSSQAVASTIEQYVVDRKVNNSRTVDRDDPSVIAPAA